MTKLNIIIYKKENGHPFLQESISSFYKKESYNPSPNIEHVVKNHGGTKEDYDILWLDEVDPKVYTHEFIIQNREIVFGAEKVFEEPLHEPTDIEKLQQENKLLKAQNQALAERTDFHEDVLQEIILSMYS